MRGPKIEGTISRTKTVRNFAKTAESLAKPSAAVPNVALVQSENPEKVVQLPGYLGSTGGLGSTQRPREQVPALLVIDTSLNEDLADSESPSQEIHQSPGALGIQSNLQEPSQRGVSFALAGSHKLEFDLDPR